MKKFLTILFVCCALVANNQTNSYKGIISGVIASSQLDLNVRSFITTAGITNGTQIHALNNLVRELKRLGIWSKAVAIYPFVGGTSTTCKYNLVNTATFTLTFNGTITFASTGITGNGTTGYYDTGINPSTQLSLNSTSMFLYSRTNSSVTVQDIGVIDAGIALRIDCRAVTGAAFGTVYTTSTPLTAAVASSIGFFGVSRVTSANAILATPGSITTTSSTSVALINQNIYGLAQNGSGTPGSYSAREQAFAWIGTGLTTTEIADLRTAVNAFQTTLGR